MNQESKSTLKNAKSGRWQADMLEMKTQLVRAYVDQSRAQKELDQQRRASAPSDRKRVLIFTAEDDALLFGIDAVENEFATRKLDPYCWYKQQLAASTRAMNQSRISESA